MNAPTYGKMGDHTETVQVDYDPRRITYAQLLDIFWKSHKPTSGSWSRQYLNVVFYHNEEQRLQALASKAAVEQKIGHAVKTEVAPLRSFTMAEDYHQKYTLKRHQTLLNEMTLIYPGSPPGFCGLHCRFTPQRLRGQTWCRRSVIAGNRQFRIEC